MELGSLETALVFAASGMHAFLGLKRASLLVAMKPPRRLELSPKPRDGANDLCSVDGKTPSLNGLMQPI